MLDFFNTTTGSQNNHSSPTPPNQSSDDGAYMGLAIVGGGMVLLTMMSAYLYMQKCRQNFKDSQQNADEEKHTEMSSLIPSSIKRVN